LLIQKVDRLVTGQITVEHSGSGAFANIQIPQGFISFRTMKIGEQLLPGSLPE